jgi:branched-chain amino acid transport system permease protein
MVGPMVGATLLVVMSNAFSGLSQYSAGLFGLLLIGVVTLAPAGLVGIGQGFYARLRGSKNLSRFEQQSHVRKDNL